MNEVTIRCCLCGAKHTYSWPAGTLGPVVFLVDPIKGLHSERLKVGTAPPGVLCPACTDKLTK